MPMPRIAIVGRPNVGKSSLLNMMAGAKVSIVDSTPGTTRDRVGAVVEVKSPDQRPARAVEVIDTGGYGVYTAEGQRYDEIGEDLGTLRPEIEAQIAAAIREADLILFAVDAQAGVTPQDEEIARWLREGRLPGEAKAAKQQRSKAAKAGKSTDSAPKPGRSVARKMPAVRVVATKVDGPKWEAHAHELAGLGFGEPLLVSAKSNYFRRDFLDELYELLPGEAGGTPAPRGEDAGAAPAPRAPVDLMLAIIGKRNAGKSSLVNALAGEKRVIVSEIAGTTRDAVDVRFEMDGKSFLAIDTAGLRRRKSFASRIEWFAFDRAKRAVDRADVVLVLVDATEPLSQVDEQLAMVAQKAFKPVVIAVNKWDLAAVGSDHRGRPVTTARYEEYIRKELKGLDFAPIAFVSAESRLNLKETVRLAFELKDQAEQRVGTGKLNRLIKGILERSNPPSKLGTLAKCYYVAQVAVAPPTIVMVVNRPVLFTANYQRFLINRFREALPFGEVPIRLMVRGRKPGKTWETSEELSRDETREIEREAVEAAREEGAVDVAAMPAEAEAYFEEE
ncbi:MAG: ribosome biogenesis GTPase Der [Phycisphaerales bacterium]